LFSKKVNEEGEGAFAGAVAQKLTPFPEGRQRSENKQLQLLATLTFFEKNNYAFIIFQPKPNHSFVYNRNRCANVSKGQGDCL
jgi:hypothetical protein